MPDIACPSRREFLRMGTAAALAAPIASARGETAGVSAPAKSTAGAKVAIAPCKTYGSEVKTAYERCFDLLGGIGSLAKNKTVTVKVNLTGFKEASQTGPGGKPAGETYITHGDTALALAAVLLENGAKRVRFVECVNTRGNVEEVFENAGWDLFELFALGPVEIENTRNLGFGKEYSTLPVAGGGYLFSSFELNHSYEDADVFVSLAKMKNHTIAGVTLSMKNVFGITPNSRYGSDAGREDAILGRMPLHGWRRWGRRRGGGEPPELPGAKTGDFPDDHGYRVPRIVADICAARPVHLAIIDGIATMRGGEGPWCRDGESLAPGVMIAGLNPVSADAVATALMGYDNPMAERGTVPFRHGDNHLLLAHNAGLGTADLSDIEVVGTTIEKARHPFEKA